MSESRVIIAGGGVAGVTAAIAAARAGARVTLCEAHNYLGGMANQALVQPYQTFHSPRGQVIRGIPQEYVDRLVAAGGSLGHKLDPIGFAATVTPVDDAVSGRVMLDWLAEERVDVRLDTAVSGARQENGRIVALKLSQIDQSRTSLGIPFGHWETDPFAYGKPEWLECDAVVDATGSAKVRRLLGLPCEMSDARQPMSWLFAMSGVDKETLLDYVYVHTDDFVLSDDPRCREEKYVGVSGFFSLVREVKDKGEWPIPRDRLLFFETPRPREMMINTTRIPHGFGVDEAIIAEGTRQIEFLAGFFRSRVPGFSNAEISRVADRIGVRESWRSVTSYMLTRNDVVSGAKFADVIALGAFPIDIHSAKDEELHAEKVGARGCYDIPLTCLVCDEMPNLVMAGRIIGVTHEAFASTRVMPTSMAIGQAAGVAAVIVGEMDDSVGEQCNSSHLDTHTAADGSSGAATIHSELAARIYPRVSEILISQGAVLTDGQVGG